MSATARSSPRVLLVDDQAGMRLSLRNLLDDEGIPVVGEAGDGAEGVRQAQSLQPDVVLMDLRMPRMGGIEATQEIKRLRPATQIVIFTVYDDPMLHESATAVGAYACLVKGCPADEILQTVTTAWEHTRAQDT